ncbi:MAG: Beta-barrel assembly-enhancing protease [Phycisphaerae bacterium]|nr:Beta-barrel assembly-enhancing protease [Phycisphaerae bacterium]
MLRRLAVLLALLGLSPLVAMADDPAPARPRPVVAPTTQPAHAGPTTRPDTTVELPLAERAAVRLKVGFHDKAEADFRELLKNDQTKLSAIVGLAQLYRQTGKYDEAGKMLESAADDGAKSADWRLEKAELLAMLGQYEQARDLADAVLKEDEKNLHARWLVGRQLETIGQYDQARDVYKWVDGKVAKDWPATAGGRTWAGQILDRYSRLIARPAAKGVDARNNPGPVTYDTMILQQLYQVAYEELDREYWPARVAAANLSLVAYKDKQAIEDFGAALRINPSAYQANLGAGWAMLEGWKFEQVEAQLAAARKVNANDPAVFELESALLLLQRRFDDAAAAARKGLKINPRHLGLLAQLASAESLLRHDDQVAEVTKQAEAINPRPAEFYLTFADAESGARQYDLAEKLYKKVIELAPWDPNARSGLGMMYMQTGHEELASKLLDDAFSIDAFNKKSFNTLTLLEQLERFQTLESKNFIIKFSDKTDAVLGPYFRDYLESVYAELCRDYGVKLDRKAVIELFPTHAQFSVRVTGTSWIPTVGACTGWVVAMYSPRKMAGTPQGFNWAAVLRHEFTHVVTLAATHNRIPHWFTESLAVMQEPQPRKWDWVQMLVAALRQDQLFKVSQINWGFIRPKRPTDRQLAYAQSEWMGEFIIDQYGYPSIGKLLKAFDDGKTQAEALKEILGVTEDEFDAKFIEWARAQVKTVWRLNADPIPSLADAAKAVKDNPNDANAHARLAEAYVYARSPDKLKKIQSEASEALKLDPNNAKALSLLAQVLIRDKSKWDEAQDLLLKLASVDPTNAEAPRLLARHYLSDDEFGNAALWFNRLKLTCPLDPSSYAGLAAIYLDERVDNKKAALPELAELARREQSDPRYAVRLATLYTDLKQPDQAAVWLTEAMYIDPFNAATHEQLAVACFDSKQADRAISEMKVAIQLDPRNDEFWARLAYMYHGQGKSDLAKMAAKFATELNPGNGPARDLLKQLTEAPKG